MSWERKVFVVILYQQDQDDSKEFETEDRTVERKKKKIRNVNLNAIVCLAYLFIY